MFGQLTHQYNLIELVAQNKLETTCGPQQIKPENTNESLSVTGIVWLKDVDFKTGKIDIDLRGRNVFLQSFMGIAFHAKDTTRYDVVYFCPFRFHDSSDITRKYSVKYMSVPDYSYVKLRKEHPQVYENEVSPAPQADEWFHTTIVVKKHWVKVYINHAPTASLKVKRLPTLDTGKIGLWSYQKTLSSDFANLAISK